MKTIKGFPASPGIAIGKVFSYRPFSCDVEETFFRPEETEKQLAVYGDAACRAGRELDAIIEKLEDEQDDKALIFEAHKEILGDEDLQEALFAAISEQYCVPEYAVYQVFGRFAEKLSRAADPLIAARAADLRDVRNRLIRILRGEPEHDLSLLQENVIIVTHDLLPSDTASMDRSKVLGIVTEVGSATSHSAIIANSYGIAAVLGVHGAVAELPDGSFCAVDALEGTVCLEPDAKYLSQMEQKQVQYLRDKAGLQAYAYGGCMLRSGECLRIGLNVGSAEYQQAYENVDFVGLMRSEFLYMQSNHMPTEEEQYQAYVRVLRHAGGKPVTLRTLDIGGDKTLPYFDLPKEENPFLGNRALRLCLSNPELFHTQIRAALRAAAEGPLWLMFPMVGSVEDIHRAKAAVQHARQELLAEGIAFDEQMKIGIMIEIPSIAELADLAVKEVDFASIGSNDLVQYMCASDRMNRQTAPYYQSFSPAVFRMIGRVIRVFKAAGKPISVCGELAGDPAAAMILAGLGLEKFSMSGACIAGVKKTLAQFTIEELRELAEEIIMLPTQTEVKERIQLAIADKQETTLQ